MTQDSPIDGAQPPGPWSRARGLDQEAASPERVADPAPDLGARRIGADPEMLHTVFVGRRMRLFGLALKTGLLTVVTLGIYRFWMKTRLRRWYWSAIRPGGQPLEYVGDPFEKLLGFLFAVVILSFYIGVVNLLLMFASFALLQGNVAAYLLSFIGVIPLWFYAQYRARRYVLARTRWRGLRFGLEPGAWGYAIRALWYWLLTLVTAGLLWPLMTFKLEQYKTDRTFFGEARMHQGGRWTMLFPAIKWLALSIILSVVAAGATALGAYGASGLVGFLTLPCLLYGLAYYRVETLMRLTAAKRLAGARLRLAASPRRILFIYLGGYFLAALILIIPLGVVGFAAVAMQAPLLGGEGWLDATPLAGLDRWMLILIGIVGYFSVFLLWSAVTNVLVTMPVIRHFAEGLTVMQANGLDGIRQRPRDEHIEAEGFAEALDVGASI